jgi:hypothetical protein
MCTGFMIRKCEQVPCLGNLNIIHNLITYTGVIITEDSEDYSTFVCSRHKYYVTNSVSKPHNGLEGRLSVLVLNRCVTLTHQLSSTEPEGVLRTIFGVRPLSGCSRTFHYTHGSRYTACLKATVPRHGTRDPTGTNTQLKESSKSKSGPQ